MHRLIARQPVLDRAERVYGYKLHFHPGHGLIWPECDAASAEAGASVAATPVAGLDDLIDDTRAFIHCPRAVLVGGHARRLPKDRVVLEISAAEASDQAGTNACRDLKEEGFKIAIVDFPLTDENPLVQFADFIKLDVNASADRAQWLLIRKYRPKGFAFIADRVETRAQCQAALQQGYSYFQGHFFLRPQPYATCDVTPTKLVYLLVLAAVSRPEIDLDEVSRTIKHDLALSYRLLRFLNSARFALHSQVKSIRHALLLLGENELRKWIGLISVAALGEGGPPILVAIALIRAAFCESFATLLQDSKRQADYFFLGLLSSIDVLLRRPMRVILGELPIAEDVSAALLGDNSPLRGVLDVVLNFERGNWEECSRSSKNLGLKEEKIADLHLQALRWSRELTRAAEE